MTWVSASWLEWSASSDAVEANPAAKLHQQHQRTGGLEPTPSRHWPSAQVVTARTGSTSRRSGSTCILGSTHFCHPRPRSTLAETMPSCLGLRSPNVEAWVCPARFLLLTAQQQGVAWLTPQPRCHRANVYPAIVSLRRSLREDAQTAEWACPEDVAPSCACGECVRTRRSMLVGRSLDLSWLS